MEAKVKKALSASEAKMKWSGLGIEQKNRILSGDMHPSEAQKILTILFLSC
jgi:hypothetical protein